MSKHPTAAELLWPKRTPKKHTHVTKDGIKIEYTVGSPGQETPEEILNRCALRLGCEPRQVYDKLLALLKKRKDSPE